MRDAEYRSASGLTRLGRLGTGRREAGGRCAERLQSEGVDLDGYSMMEVIADLEAARIGFGYEKINLHSESYGTRLAQIYAWKHPESLHRAVLIGVNPPGHFVWEPEMVDAQLAQYAELCAQDEYCNGRSANLSHKGSGHNCPLWQIKCAHIWHAQHIGCQITGWSSNAAGSNTHKRAIIQF